MAVYEEVGYNPKSTPHKQEALDKIAGFLLGTSARIAQKYGQPCVIADMTAGPGLYENGEIGSPLIFARHISELMQRGYSLQLVCVEKEPDRLSHLRAVLRERYPDLPVSYYSDQIAAKNSIPVSAYGLTYWDPTGYFTLDDILLHAFGVTHPRIDILITRQCLATKRMLGAAHTAPRTRTIQEYLALTGKKRNYIWQYAKYNWWSFGFADNWEDRPSEKMKGLVPVDSPEGKRIWRQWTACDDDFGQGGLPWE